MAASAYVPSILSTLFRIAAFLFLRVIPARVAKIILPTLFLSYLASLSIGRKDGLTKEKTDVTAPEDKSNVNLETPEPGTPNTFLDNFDRAFTVLFDLPTSSRRLRRISLFINVLLFTSAVDLITHPFLHPAQDVVFTRVGAVTSDAVKIVVRYPQHNATEGFVKVLYRPAPSTDGTWKDGPTIHLKEKDDWVSTGLLSGLWPKSSYEYRLAPANSSLEYLPYPGRPLPFRTFPDPRIASGSHFRFVVSSCTMPNFPYVPGGGNTIKGFDLLADYIWPNQHGKGSTTPVLSIATSTSTLASENGLSVGETSSAASGALAPPIESLITGPSKITTHHVPTEPTAHTSPTPLISSEVLASPTATAGPVVLAPKAPTEFMLFLGDFVYADVPYYYGDDKEAYRRLYRRNYASSSFRKIYERLPVFHMYDDHEIINNYVGVANDSTPPFPNASNAFDIYQAQANYDSVAMGQYYYDFRYGDVAFFVMDTRRYRSNITDGDLEAHTMLGDKQAAAFHTWLSQVNQTTTFKFIVSSVPFTSLWQHDAITDSWAGFGTEKASVLAAVQSVPNVIILSGDRHEFAAIEYAAPSSSKHTVLEVSTSPLSMFYVPFFRTLHRESEKHLERRVNISRADDDGVLHIEERSELVPEERAIEYIAQGNFKWSAFEIDTRNLEKPVAHLEVMIDGHPAYRLQIDGTPVKLRTSTALGAFFPQTFKAMLDKLGLAPSKWF